MNPPAQLRRSIDLCIALAVIVSLLLGLWPAPPAQAQTTRTPTITVGDVALGGVLRIVGYGFAPGQIYNAQMVAGRQPTPLGRLTVQRNGELMPLDFPLPRDFVAAAYSVEVVDSRGTIVANSGRPVTIHPAPIFTLNPTGGAPGTLVTVNAHGLLGGSLRLLYAGAPVLRGRVNRDGTYSGHFVVPNDRPRPLGSVAQVTLQNLRADQRIGQASGVFHSAPEPAVERPTIQDLAASRTALRAGMPFSLTGRIVPPPAPGRAAAPPLTAVWQDAQGDQYILPSSGATIAGDGSFVVTALAPSYVNGDPVTLRQGDKFGVALALDGGSVSQLVDQVIDPLDGVFRFSVVKNLPGTAADRTPIPNTPTGAIYAHITPRLAFSTTLDVLIDLSSSSVPLLNNALIVGGILTDNLNNQFNAGKLALANCFVYNQQSAIPWWEWQMTPEQAAIITTQPGDDLLASLQTVQLEIPAGPVAARARQLPPGSPVTVVLLEVLVDALDVEEKDAAGNVVQKGYGYVHLKDGKPYATVYEQLYAWIPELDLVFEIHFNLAKSIAQELPFQIALPPLPADTLYASSVGSVKIGGVPIPLDAGIVGNFFSIHNAPPTETVAAGTMTVRFRPGGGAAYGTVEDMTKLAPEVTFNGEALPVKKEFTNNATGYCDMALPYGIIEMEVAFPFAHLPADKLYPLTFAMKGLADDDIPETFWLRLVPLPVNDAEIGMLSNRKWSVGVWGAAMTAPALNPAEDNSTSGGDLKEAGNRNNGVAVGTTVNWTRLYDPYGQNVKGAWIRPPQEGTLTSQSLNNAAADLSFGDKQTSAAGTDALAVKYDVKQTILDTGKISIFKAQYGIPGIASVGISVDFQVTAVAGIKTTAIATTVGFDSSVKIWAAIEAEILMGLASAEVGAVATIGVGFNTTYALGGDKDAQECFHYRMDLYYEIEALWGAAEVASGEYNLFAGWDPSTEPCKPSTRSLAQRGRAAMPSPALATDGYGNTLALWRAADGRILASVRGEDDWLPPQVVHNSGRSIEPAVAFFDVNRAVAVWAESNRAAPPTRIPVYEAMRTLHLRYALWDGATWSAAADLTLPTSGGDGRVTLAGCMATDNHCPLSGEVTALWVHDEAADIRQRHFRIYSATLRNGAWTSPVAVDEGGGGSRTEPTLAYADGVAVAAWVHDPDRTLDSMMDRRLRLRTLDGSSAVVQPAAIPGGVVAPHLAADGKGGLHIAFTRANPDEGAISNRRLLHYAVSACPDGGCPSLRSTALNDRSWALNALVDPKGRGLVGESPVVTVDNGGKATVTLRMLGLNPIAPPNTPLIAVQEPLGVMAHTGELAQIEMGLSLPVVIPTYLTFDGALNWQPNAVYDPLSGNTLFMAVTGSAPDVSAQQRSLSRQGRNAAQATGLGDDLIGGALSRAPNFILGDVQLAQNYFHDEQPVQATVTVHNSGASWQAGDGAPLTVAAAWDAPVGRGNLAAETTVTALGGGESLAVTLQLAPPTRSPTGEHILYVVVNPHGQLAEQSLADNEVELSFGALPAPVNLFAHAADGAGFLILQWSPVDDRRVVGYKVYRVTEDGSLSAAGSSPVAGWRDAHPVCAEICRYVVTAYTADLQESAASDEISVPKPEFVLEPPDPLSSNRLYLPSVMRSENQNGH